VLMGQLVESGVVRPEARERPVEDEDPQPRRQVAHQDADGDRPEPPADRAGGRQGTGAERGGGPVALVAGPADRTVREGGPAQDQDQQVRLEGDVGLADRRLPAHDEVVDSRPEFAFQGRLLGYGRLLGWCPLDPRYDHGRELVLIECLPVYMKEVESRWDVR
jgi:hypothetical protein